MKPLLIHQKNENKDDEDMHFLKSIHPFFASMTPIQKLKVRTQIQEILMKEIYSPSLQPTMSTHFSYPHQPSYPIQIPTPAVQTSQHTSYQNIQHLQSLTHEQPLNPL